MKELLDLYAIDPALLRVVWVDGFLGMEAAVDYLKANPDERCYCFTDIAHNIRAVAFFSGDKLLILTGGGV